MDFEVKMQTFDNVVMVFGSFWWPGLAYYVRCGLCEFNSAWADLCRGCQLPLVEKPPVFGERTLRTWVGDLGRLGGAGHCKVIGWFARKRFFLWCVQGSFALIILIVTGLVAERGCRAHGSAHCRHWRTRRRGKASLINSLRGISPGELDAAKVGL